MSTSPELARASWPRRFEGALFGVLDRCIRPLPADVDELLRRRMVAGLSLVQVVEGFGLSAALQALHVPLLTVMLCGVCGVVSLTVLTLLRRGARLLTLTLLTCGWPLTLMGICGLHADGGPAMTGPWLGVLVLLAFYLEGRAGGFAAALYGGFLLLCSFLAIHTGHTLAGRALPSDMQPWNWVQAPVVLLTFLTLGWLQISAQQRGVRALREAIAAAEGAEAKFKSVLENTSDSVASLDTQLRLVTFNGALARHYGPVSGKPMRAGEPLVDPAAERFSQWKVLSARALAGEHVSYEAVFPSEAGPMVWEVSLNPARLESGEVTGLTLFARDVSVRRQLEEQAAAMNRNLIKMSRMAGMAEVATGILHNVGNTLNSVSVSATLLEEAAANLPVARLARAVGMLEEHRNDQAAFIQSEKGQKLLLFLATLCVTLEDERGTLQREVKTLLRNVDHIKHVVSMQQGHARGAGVTERVVPEELIDDALRLHENAFSREGILLRKDVQSVSALTLDRHRVLQILVNLISNARHATLDSAELDKSVTVRVRQPDGRGLLVEVEDNGVGIEPANASRIFQQGFTTKPSGHGFGLHNSILIARELGGTLTCRSAGPGKGACFSLHLPDADQRLNPETSPAS